MITAIKYPNIIQEIPELNGKINSLIDQIPELEEICNDYEMVCELIEKLKSTKPDNSKKSVVNLDELEILLSELEEDIRQCVKIINND